MDMRCFVTALGLVACIGTVDIANAEQAVHGWYSGLGLGLSHVDPDTGGTTFRVDDSQSYGYRVFVGYDLNERWAVEGYYSDLGEAKLFPAGSIKYNDLGVTGMYYFYQAQPARRSWSVFVRAGIGSMSNDTEVNYTRKNDTHVMYGAGVLYPFAEDWSVRLDVDLYDKDAQFASVGLVWNFDSRSSAPSESQSTVEPQPALPADSDADGVADNLDQCPDTVVDAKVDGNGCDLRPTIILEGVNFKSSSAELAGDSRTVLDKVAWTLKRYPELEVEVAGYTDSSGLRADNVALSQQRAEAVRKYLVGQGLSAEMFSAHGYGPENPVADNGTVDGRALNRRVELHINEVESSMSAEPDTVPESTEEMM